VTAVSEETFEVKVPDSAVAGDTVDEPTVKLLRTLNLLPTDKDLAKGGGASALFKGPPDSVALIEAGATAAAKWWATGLGAAVIAIWGPIREWWLGEDAGTQEVALWIAGIVTAAAVVGIAYLLASDVRGRAAAMAETIRARATVADAFVRAAESAHARTPVGSDGGGDGTVLRFAALPAPLKVNNHVKGGKAESGWRAIALLTDGEKKTQYLVVKGTDSDWVAAGTVEFAKRRPGVSGRG
jgi:hypothetical protein